LFVSNRPLSLKKLSQISGTDPDTLTRVLDELATELTSDERGLELVKTPTGYELRIKPEYRPLVTGLAPLADLSDGALRTLALIILKQPIRQSLIVKVQGNKTYGYVKTLVEKGLIDAPKWGRTRMLTTARDFERYFGMTSRQMRALIMTRLKKKVEREARPQLEAEG
jgi:segregation and condensation protein B